MEGVLLEKCRENMRDNAGKLNVHLYEALKKALYKPAAFFKGILFPLCEVSDCGLDSGNMRLEGRVRGGLYECVDAVIE